MTGECVDDMCECVDDMCECVDDMGESDGIERELCSQTGRSRQSYGEHNLTHPVLLLLQTRKLISSQWFKHCFRGIHVNTTLFMIHGFLESNARPVEYKHGYQLNLPSPDAALRPVVCAIVPRFRLSRVLNPLWIDASSFLKPP